MKMVTAIIRAEKIKDVEKALRRIGVPGYTYYPVKGHGSEFDVEGGGRVAIFLDVLPRKKIQIICPASMVDEVITAVREAIATGHHGDGIIYVTSVERIVRISTGEEGEAVFKH